jgi:hypothetical protein
VKANTNGIRTLEDYFVWLKDHQHPPARSLLHCASSQQARYSSRGRLVSDRGVAYNGGIVVVA